MYRNAHIGFHGDYKVHVVALRCTISVSYRINQVLMNHQDCARCVCDVPRAHNSGCTARMRARAASDRGSKPQGVVPGVLEQKFVEYGAET